MTMKLLRELSEAAGVPGREENIRKIVMRELKGHVDSMEVDAMGNLIAFRRGTAKDRQRVMFAAHMDEIGLIVTHVDENGFARFTTLGGVRAQNLPEPGRVPWWSVLSTKVDEWVLRAPLNYAPLEPYRENAVQLATDYGEVLTALSGETGTALRKLSDNELLVSVAMPVQLGGGIRDLDTIEKYIDGGIRYVIIGTAAVKNPGFLKDACSAFGGHIIVGLDAKDGKVATDGWSKLTGHEVVDLARKFEDYGVESIIYTDIGRDGMLSGINIEATVKLAQALTIPVIASGGLAGMADIEKLCAVEEEGIEGVICGRAIYSGDLDFEKAQARADELNG